MSLRMKNLFAIPLLSLSMVFLSVIQTVPMYAQDSVITPPDKVPTVTTPTQPPPTSPVSVSESIPFGYSLSSKLNADNELLPGDAKATGTSTLIVFPAFGVACAQFTVKNLSSPATHAMLHKAQVGKAGPIALELPTPSTYGLAFRCYKADSEILSNISQNPENYYINVYNNKFPTGAIRGQLTF